MIAAMTALQIVMLVVQTSILLVVFGIGLRATLDDALHMVRRPAGLLRALLAMFVVMPLLAVLLDRTFDLRPEVEIAIVALAISPIPPLLPLKESKAGADTSYGLGLMVSMAVLAIVLVPLASELLGLAFGHRFAAAPATIARIILLMVVLPLAAGILCHHLAPQLARRLQKPVALVGNLLLGLVGLVVIFASRESLLALIGNGTLLALVGFVVVGLAVGHLLGGSDPRERSVLALSTACRHPGIAVAIATINFPDNQLLTAAVLLYLIVNLLVCIPYVKWRRRQGVVR